MLVDVRFDFGADLVAQQRRIDCDLAEVVQPPGPAQPVDVGEGEAQRAREAVDVAGDAERMAIRRGIALVDDVRERLQRAERLALQAAQPHLRVMDGDRERDEHNDVPRMAEREQRDRCAEARFAGARDEARVEVLARADDVEQQRAQRQVGEREGDQWDEVVQELHAADIAACDFEHEPCHADGAGVGQGVEEHLARVNSVEQPGCDGADGRDEGGPPRAEHDHRGDLDAAGDPEAIRMDRSAQPLAVGILEQPHENCGGEKHGQGRMAHRGSIGRIRSPA